EVEVDPEGECSLLVGRRLDDPMVAAFLRSMGAPEEVSFGEDERTLSWPGSGLEVQVDYQDVVTTMFFYCTPTEGYQPYPGLLPRGLSALATPESAGRVLGEPSRTGSGWDRWDRSTFSLHVQYAGDRVGKVTLMASEAVPA
ncbi:MAG: hypothetical protein AB1758_31910, partial [Candidatus Eremiobacterota bacterium]